MIEQLLLLAAALVAKGNELVKRAFESVALVVGLKLIGGALRGSQRLGVRSSSARALFSAAL